MGVLRQKCVPTYEAFLNGSNVTSVTFNNTYESYLKEIDNESTCDGRAAVGNFGFISPL